MQPLAVPSLPSAVTAAAGEQSTNLRVGRITAINSGRVTVAIGGTVATTDAVYLTSYTPVLGDYVQVAWQGSSLLVLGALTGNPPDNLAPNWSFEASQVAVGAPANWAVWTVAGTATTEVVNIPDGAEIDGRQAAKITVTSAGGTSRIYSSQIGVVPGQMWSVGAQVAVAGASADTITAGLYLAWQVGAGDLPPTLLSLESVCAQSFTGSQPDWYQLRGGGVSAGKTAPYSANFVRVVLSVATGAAGSAAYFDRVTLRKIS